MLNSSNNEIDFEITKLISKYFVGTITEKENEILDSWLLDDNANAWHNAILQDKINWIHLINENGWKSNVVELYNIDALPAIFVLDSNNNIISKSLRVNELCYFIQSYFDK